MKLLKKIWALLDEPLLTLRAMYVFCVGFTSYAIMSNDFPNLAKLIMFVCTVVMVLLVEYEVDE